MFHPSTECGSIQMSFMSAMVEPIKHFLFCKSTQALGGIEMRARVKWCLRPGVPLVFLFAILIFMPAPASSEETYKFERMWPTLQQPWYFYQPHGMATDRNGNVYVVDTENHRIQKITSGGKVITRWGSNGSGDGQFDDPNDIAIDDIGNVYVADKKNNRIQKFSENGTFIWKWGNYGNG